MRLNRVLWGAILASMIPAGDAGAGQITNVQLYDGMSASPLVTVDYSNADGTGNNVDVTYADPQVSGGTTAPIYYCVDIWHENFPGATYTITPVSSIEYATSTFSDVDNRIAWLLNQPQNTVDERAAIQLAIWYTTDNIQTSQFSGFSFSGGDAALLNDYNNLISFAGYDPSVHYAAQFWAATHDPTNQYYQDMVSAVPSITGSAVPEPDSGILAGIGVVAVWGISVWRRRQSVAAAG
jgi:Thioester domain